MPLFECPPEIANIQKSIALPYTNNELTEIKIKNTISFRIAQE